MENIKVEDQFQKTEDDKKTLLTWVKENKEQLLLAGVGITTLMLTILGLKNQKSVIDLWNTLKEEINKGAKYSTKWLENSSLDDIEKARDLVHIDYMNVALDQNYRGKCLELLHRLDKVIEERKWAGKDYVFPIYSSNGPYLLSDD